MGNSRLKLLICAAVVVVSISCGSAGSNSGRRGNSNANDNSQTDAIAVTVGKSESREVASTIQATGSLLADETSDIAPRVAGKIANVFANVGQFVSQGATIAKIDDTNAREALATATAAVRQSIVSIRSAEARLGLGPNQSFSSSAVPEVRAANANYQQALAELKQAEANELRYRELIESGDVARMTYETYRTARDTARARASNAKETLDAAVNTAKQSNQAIALARAQVESNQTLVVQAQQALTDTVIHAPFSGYISSRPTAVGEYVTSASIIATILRTNPIKVQIQIAEAEVPAVTIGHGVSAEVDAYKDRKFAGSVTAVNPAVDPASRSAVVEAKIENGDNALRSGMFATVKINREGGNVAGFVPKTEGLKNTSPQTF